MCILESGTLKLSLMEFSLRKVSPFEPSFLKVRTLEAGSEQINCLQVSTLEICASKVWNDAWVVYSPRIPSLYS